MLERLGICLHTQLMSESIKDYYDRFPAVSVKALKSDPPPKGIQVVADPVTGLVLADEDYEAEGIPVLERAALAALHLTCPVSDPDDPFADPEAAAMELRSAFGDRLITQVSWGDPTTDEALARFVSQGLAAHRVERRNDNLVVDLEYLLDYEVRSGFARYGAKLVMDLGFRPLRIEREGHVYTPGHPQWELAKLRFRAAVALDVTIRDHAVQCHLMISNAGVIATRDTLSPDHPLRRLLLPFQFRTPTINRDGLLTLVGRQAIFHRLFALEWPALKRLYEHSVRSYRFAPFDEDLRQRGMEGVKGYLYREDGLLFFNRLQRFVQDYFAQTRGRWTSADRAELSDFSQRLQSLLPADLPDCTSEPRLQEMAAYLIFNSTGYHEQVGGGIADYLSDLRLGPPVVWDAPTFADSLPRRNTMYQAFMLGVLTNLRMPHIGDDIGWLFRDEAARAAVERFTASMQELDADIAARNSARQQPYWIFAPRCMELSVSL